MEYLSVSGLSFEFLLVGGEGKVVLGLAPAEVGSINLVRFVVILISGLRFKWEFAGRVLIFFALRRPLTLFGGELGFISGSAFELVRIGQIFSSFGWGEGGWLSVDFMRTVLAFVFSFVLQFELGWTVLRFCSFRS